MLGISGITGKMLLNGNVVVDAQANIYNAGTTVSPIDIKEGTLPSVIEFEAMPAKFDPNFYYIGSQIPITQQVLIFPNITGEISCCTPNLYNGPDGGTFGLGSTKANSINGISGFTANRTMFLVGVFTSAPKPNGSFSPTLDYIISPDKNFHSSKPQLNMAFFIGDGRDNDNNLQSFDIPAEASHLYLGFVDGDGSGIVGFYDDNSGQLSVDYEIFNSVDRQKTSEPQHPIVNQGKILHYTFDEQRYIAPENDEGKLTYGNLKDSSGFGFHGRLYNDEYTDSVANFIYEPAKYNQAIQSNTSIEVINISPYIEGVPIGNDWSIATWFMHDLEHLGLNVSPFPRICRPGPSCNYVHVTTNPLNNYELGTNQNDETNPYFMEHVGSGFYMTSLAEGWHHLTVIGTQGKTEFYIDGNLVGETDSQLTANIYQIQAWMLDDFRVYNTVLLPTEINLLAEKSTTLPEEYFTNDCTASYLPEGKLHIPCVSVPDALGNTTIYDIQMQQQIDSFTFNLDMDSIKLH